MLHSPAKTADIKYKMQVFGKTAAYFFIAFRYLIGRSNKKGRYLLGATAGIALSLVPIMVTLVVTDGMIRGITDRFLELGTGHIQIRSYQPALEAGFNIDLALPFIEELDGIRGVWHEIDGIGIIMGALGKTGVTIRAVTPSFWEDEGSRKYLDVIEGSAKIQNDNDVLVGAQLAKTVGAEVGKTLRIMTVRTTEDGRNIPRTMAFTVRGIVSSGYHEIDAMWCLVDYETGKQLLSGESAEPFLIVKTNDPYTSLEASAALINRSMSGFFHALTWKQIQPLQYSSYEQTRQILLFIMALIVLVAAVNVSSAISMLVIERQRDIAVLKAFGTGEQGTASIFLFGGFLTGLVGMSIGITTGLIFGTHINEIIHALEWLINFWAAMFNLGTVKILDPGFYLESIPIIINWPTVAGIGIFTLICSVLSSAVPAYRAGSAKPVELLRKY